MDASQALDQLERHLCSPTLTWLLGAGISFEANIPLMVPLTERICQQLQAELPIVYETYQAIRSHLSQHAHIEHVLSHIGDLVSLADRSPSRELHFQARCFQKTELTLLHNEILSRLRKAIQCGYRPANSTAPERIGTEADPIVDVSKHEAFARAIFKIGHAGIQHLRQPVRLFTTNYDTLIEDAMAFEGFYCIDGFRGGAVASWAPTLYDNPDNHAHAHLYKLHGSIDWFFDKEENMFRCRDLAYQKRYRHQVLIYPQQNKYLLTQRDPFSFMLRQFRNTLHSSDAVTIAICGYSFGDEHINLEIISALRRPENNITVICFVKEIFDDNANAYTLPKAVGDFLHMETHKGVFVLSDQGLYLESVKNLLPPKNGTHSWWTFSGVIERLGRGFQGDLNNGLV